jgi:membrane associated rhomboid family serine protease
MLKLLRFLGLLLVALTLGLTWCHVLEIPGKLRLGGAEWLTVQHNLYIAFGPPVGAPIEVAAILLAWWVFVLVRRRWPAAGWTLAGAICTTLGLVVWFWLVAPMNAIIAGWTPQSLPPDWTAVRNQWEIGQAAHAALFGLGFGALVAALLAETPR